jgi:hypothetical protein
MWSQCTNLSFLQVSGYNIGGHGDAIVDEVFTCVAEEVAFVETNVVRSLDVENIK